MSIRNLFVAAGVTVGLMSGAAMAAGPETVAALPVNITPRSRSTRSFLTRR